MSDDGVLAKAKHFTTDGFSNFMARLGLGSGSQQDGSHYRQNFTSRNRQQLEAAYRTNWIAGMAVDTVAEDMTREGAEITSDMDPDDKSAIQHGLDRYEVWNRLNDLVSWSRLYGGAIGVLLIDGQNPTSPLNLDTIQPDQFKGLLVLDRWLVQPSLQDLVTDYGPHMGEPRYYDVIADSMALSRQRIHYTRVIRLEGVRLPYWQRISENLWGQSVLERLWDRMVAFDSTTAGAAQLVYKAHLRTFKVEGLRQIIANGGGALDGLMKQVEMMRATQSNEGMTLMDKEDEYEAHQYSFSGLSDMILQFGQQLSGALQIPLVRLFGQSPAGLSSTGEADLRTYYDNIKGQQNKDLRRGLHVIFEVLSRSELGKPLDDGFDFSFRSLWQMTDPERATVASTVGTVLNTLESEGNLTHAQVLRELRSISSKTGVFGSISDKDIEEAENEPPDVLPEVPVPGDGPVTDPHEVGNDPSQETRDAWEESKHPRADDGRFGDKSGSESKMKKAPIKVYGATLVDHGDVQSGKGEDLVTLYHGTDQEGYEAIKASGHIQMSAGFTPLKSEVMQFAGVNEDFEYDEDAENDDDEYYFFTVKVPRERLVPDLESVDIEDKDSAVDEALDKGGSMYVNGDVYL